MGHEGGLRERSGQRHDSVLYNEKAARFAALACASSFLELVHVDPAANLT